MTSSIKALLIIYIPERDTNPMGTFKLVSLTLEPPNRIPNVLSDIDLRLNTTSVRRVV